MLIILYIFLMLIAGGLLIAGYKFRSWLPCFISTILFAVCGLQAFDLEIATDTGTFVVFTDPVFVGLGMLGMIIGIVFTLVGAIGMLNQRKGKEQ